MITERNFSSPIPDNDEQYFLLLEGVISSVDEYSSLTITKSPNSYYFRIVPSDPVLIDLIISGLIALHKILQIKINLGKSIKNSASIGYSLSIFA